MSLLHPRTRFKLEEEIIKYAMTHGSDSIAVGAGVTGTVTISGESGIQWLTYYFSGFEKYYGGNTNTIAIVDAITGTVYCAYLRDYYRGTANFIIGIISYNAPKNWIYNVFRNASGATMDFYYKYFAHKTKSSLINFENPIVLHNRKPSHNPTKRIRLPKVLDPLRPYAFIDEFNETSILLKKDEPRIVNEKTGWVYSKLTMWVTLKDFKSLFGDLIADKSKRPLMDYMYERSKAKNMGWEEFIDKWREEGIVF